MGFENIYNHKAIVKESANARVNLIGEHTDYTGGYVMPTLLGFKNTIELSKNEEKTPVHNMDGANIKSFGWLHIHHERKQRACERKSNGS